MITKRNAVLSDALAHLRDAEDVFVRLALSRDETDHTILRTLIIDVLPPSWLAHHDDELLRPWLEDQYIAEANAAFFYCGLLRSSIVAGWFSEPQECRLTGFDDRPGHSTRSLRFALPDVHDSVTAWWGTSHAATGAKAIPYPSTLYTFHLKTTRAGQSRDDDPLVREGGLYFPNFRVARAELMFGLTDRNQAVLREDLLAVRVVHAEGWLKKIHVLPDKVTATIAGTQVIGKAYVAIQGSGLRARKEVFGRHVSPDLPSKLPDQVELLLLSDKLLDHAEFTALEHPSPRKSP